MTLTIHEVTAQEAPVAILAHHADWRLDSGPLLTKTYRWWRGHLYTRSWHQGVSRGPWETHNVSRFRQHVDKHFQAQLSDSSGYRSKHERRQDLFLWVRDILFINGERWECSGEPR